MKCEVQKGEMKEKEKIIRPAKTSQPIAHAITCELDYLVASNILHFINQSQYLQALFGKEMFGETLEI